MKKGLLVLTLLLAGCIGDPSSGYEITWATVQCAEHSGIERLHPSRSGTFATVVCVDQTRWNRIKP